MHLARCLDVAQVEVIHHHIDAAGDTPLITYQILVEQGLPSLLLLQFYVGTYGIIINDAQAVGQLDLLVDHATIAGCVLQYTCRDALVCLREQPCDDRCDPLQAMTFKGVGVPVLLEADGRHCQLYFTHNFSI